MAPSSTLTGLRKPLRSPRLFRPFVPPERFLEFWGLVGSCLAPGGREFQVYKILYDPTDLTDGLNELGWRFDIRQTDRYFLYGQGHRGGA